MLFKFLFVLFLIIVFIYYLPLVETYSNKSVSVYNFGAQVLLLPIITKI